MTWFLLRRFVFKSAALNYHENIKLTEQVKAGRIRRELADRRPVHPGPHRLPLPGRELPGGAGAVGAGPRRPLAALRHGRQRPVGRPERGRAGGGAARFLVDRPGPDPGLHPLLPLHQAHPPDHVGRQLPAAPQAQLARRDRAHRHGGRDHRAVRRGHAGATALEAHPRRLLLHHVQPLPGRLPGLHHRQGAVAVGAGDQQAHVHQRQQHRSSPTAARPIRCWTTRSASRRSGPARPAAPASRSARWATSRCSTSSTCGATR